MPDPFLFCHLHLLLGGRGCGIFLRQRLFWISWLLCGLSRGMWLCFFQKSFPDACAGNNESFDGGDKKGFDFVVRLPGVVRGAAVWWGRRLQNGSAPAVPQPPIPHSTASLAHLVSASCGISNKTMLFCYSGVLRVCVFGYPA